MAPTYLAELSPADKRGMVSSMFQLMVMTGILVAYITNWSFENMYTGWRWMLGFAAIPAAIMFFGAFTYQNPLVIWLRLVVKTMHEPF